MRRLSRTTVGCCTSPLSRVYGYGSRPGRGGWATGSRTHLGLRGERVKAAQQWLGHSDPATTLRHYVRLTTAARAKAVAGLDEVTRAALERAEEKMLQDARPSRDNVVELASRRL